MAFQFTMSWIQYILLVSISNVCINLEAHLKAFMVHLPTSTCKNATLLIWNVSWQLDILMICRLKSSISLVAKTNSTAKFWIIIEPVRWLVSGLISPASAGLLWEENIVGWLISPGWNQQANRLIAWVYGSHIISWSITRCLTIMSYCSSIRNEFMIAFRALYKKDKKFDSQLVFSPFFFFLYWLDQLLQVEALYCQCNHMCNSDSLYCFLPCCEQDTHLKKLL